MTTNVRALAAMALTPLLRNQGSLNTQLAKSEGLCPEKDRALLRELSYGTMRFYPQLNTLLTTLQNRPFKYKDIEVKAIALIGLYQLKHMRVPAHAAINESVNACKQLNTQGAAKLINAILRRYQRDHVSLEESMTNNEVYRFNHPEWMIAKLKNNWPEHWQQILETNNQQAPLTLRINQRSCSRNDYQQQLTQIIESEATRFSHHGLHLAESINVETLPGYQVGAFSVQDEAAQLSAQLLDLKPAQRILDACAAPGGKLCHILETEANLLAVDAIEIDAKRSQRIKENLQRLRVQANLIIADAASQTWWSGKKYDRILLDAPCSATGVIRRNPDIKYLRKSEDIHELSKLQYSILENCWAMLKPGGKLLYATCSIFPQENERLVGRFISHQDRVKHLRIEAEWGIERDYGRQLFPQKNGHDGFYYALLQKKE